MQTLAKSVADERPTKSFLQFIQNSPSRLALPIAVYPGIAISGGTVRDIVTSAEMQVSASRAMQERYQTPAILTAMDLSVEAEAFGCKLAEVGANGVPTVAKPLVTSAAQVEALRVPEPGEKRTAVYLEVVRRFSRLPTPSFVLAASIGPFSLAARLLGVSETMESTLIDPGLTHRLLEKCTRFLHSYIRAFEAAGADGLIMAEPMAGLLSPPALAEFSSAYVRQLVKATAHKDFCFILHNCAATLAHLPAILESSAQMFHFGAPMDLPQALDQAPASTVLCGNLDPTEVFVRSRPDQVRDCTRRLAEATRDHRNFFISSGCDVPASAPLGNLDAFFQAVAESYWRRRARHP